jgi:hypothetical protein
LLIPDYITAGSLDADVLYQHVQLDIDLMQAVAELEANRSGANLLLNPNVHRWWKKFSLGTYN